MSEKREKILVISLLPGQRMDMKTQEVERSVVLDTKGADSFILADHALAYNRSSRIGIPKQPRPIAVRFEGDGEGVDLFYGPDRDWREEALIPDEGESVSEDDINDLYARSVQHVDALREEAEIDALRRADEPPKPPSTFGWQTLMYLAVLVAVIMLFMASGAELSIENLSLTGTAEEVSE